MQVSREELERRHQALSHDRCFACGTVGDTGLGLEFHSDDSGEVSSTWQPDARWRSYPDQLHGGVVASLLDAAMVHALFSLGHQAVTARLEIRYHHPVQLDAPVVVRGRRLKFHHGLHHMEATLVQDDILRARAEASFLEPRVKPPSLPRDP